MSNFEFIVLVAVILGLFALKYDVNTHFKEVDVKIEKINNTLESLTR